MVVERHKENGEVPSHVLGHGYGPLDMEQSSVPADIGGGSGHAGTHSASCVVMYWIDPYNYPPGNFL